MPDLNFETFLAGQLRQYAEAGVRPIDRFAIAEETIAVGRTMPRWLRSWGLASMRGNRVLVPLLIGLLLAALGGGALLVGGRLLAPPPPSRDSLVDLPDLSRPMAHPLVAPLADGRALVIGNGGEGGDPTVTAELYDPATGTSTPIGPIGTPRGFVDSAVPLNDGRVLLLADGDASILDPATRRIAPVGPMVTPRRGPTAVLNDGRVLIAGGITPGGGYKTDLTSAELFDPDTLTFSATGPMATSAEAMATLPDGRVFVAPGNDGMAQVFDPATRTFSPAGRPFPDFTGIPIGLPDGRVALFGSGAIQSRRHTAVWDPTSLTFSAAGAPLGQITGATLLGDGRVLLIGCGDGRPENIGPHWTSLFDPATGIMAAGPQTAACQPTVGGLPDGRAILVGGLDGTGSYLEGSGIHDTPAVSAVEIFQP
jgi:hypothetical protein